MFEKIRVDVAAAHARAKARVDPALEAAGSWVSRHRVVVVAGAVGTAALGTACAVAGTAATVAAAKTLGATLLGVAALAIVVRGLNHFGEGIEQGVAAAASAALDAGFLRPNA